MGVGTVKGTPTPESMAEECFPGPAPPLICAGEQSRGFPNGPHESHRARYSVTSISSAPIRNPGSTHLVIVFVDILVEFMQGHSCPKVSRVVLGRTERGERNEGCRHPPEEAQDLGKVEAGEGGLGDGGKDGPPYRSGVTGQACSARGGSGPKGLLVKTPQVGSFSRVWEFHQGPASLPLEVPAGTLCHPTSQAVTLHCSALISLKSFLR